MNERQRDLFLWVWSRRRAPGPVQVAARGAVIGALGGLAFSIIMLSSMGAPAAAGYTGLSAIIPMLERGWLMLTLAVPAFAFLGFLGANRVYAANERMYQSMLQSGARVPEQKPIMQGADHWPAIMVGVAAAIIAGFILFLFWAASTGNL
jgi:hypothetical protein